MFYYLYSVKLNTQVGNQIKWIIEESQAVGRYCSFIPPLKALDVTENLVCLVSASGDIDPSPLANYTIFM